MAQVSVADEGVQPGDEIGPALDRLFQKGNEVIIPEGRYQFSQNLFDALWPDDGPGTAILRGQGNVVLELPDKADPQLVTITNEGDVEIHNIDITGNALTDAETDPHRGATEDEWNLHSHNGYSILLDGVHVYPSVSGGLSPFNFYVHSQHESEITFRNCSQRRQPSHGWYASNFPSSATVNWESCFV